MSRKQGKELTMRKVREILRLGLVCQLSQRRIAQSCHMSQASVSKFLNLAKQREIEGTQVSQFSDEELMKALGLNSEVIYYKMAPMPDFKQIHEELKKKSVTLRLLWEEYKYLHPSGYQYSQFCEHYSRFKQTLNRSLRQTHKAGEKLFVDYAGESVKIYNRESGKFQAAQIFVAVLGASNYSYCEASWTQSLPDWIASHIRAFEFFGAVSKVVVPDNLKSGVKKACFYEPDINPTYHELALHYGTVILPTRVRKPKDKAKVEVAVQIVERWILAALRHRSFFSLEELNRAIRRLLERLNQRPFKKLPGSRLSCFQTLELPALLALPQQRYSFAQWKKAKVNIDYHVELQRHYYSVPYSLCHQEVQMRYSSETLEIFSRGKRVASHKRDDRPGLHSTQEQHMPKGHREHLHWSPSRLIDWAATIGPATAKLVAGIMDQRSYPEQGYRSCLGIMRLAKLYTANRVESASQRAILIGAFRYSSVHSILKKGLDRHPLSKPEPTPQLEHENIRGAHYYQ